jgi:transcriptional regulator with PAS, ATPase and Fis domain
MEMLKSYHWPGNIRELYNVVESMLIIERGKVIDAASVQKYLRNFQDNGHGRNLPVFTHKTPEQAERELIYRALLEMKSDIMDIRTMLDQQHGQRLAVGSSYVETPIDTENHANGERFVSLDEMEKRMIITALERFEGNRRLAAKALNISERTLYRKIKEYGLE